MVGCGGGGGSGEMVGLGGSSGGSGEMVGLGGSSGGSGEMVGCNSGGGGWTSTTGGGLYPCVSNSGAASSYPVLIEVAMSGSCHSSK